MSNPDIVVTVGADTRQATQALQNVQDETVATTAAITSSLTQLVSRMRAFQIRRGFNQAAGVLAAGGGIPEALTMGVAAAFPQIGAPIAGVEFGQSLLFRLSGMQGRLARAQQQLAQPTSLAEDVKAFKDEAEAEAFKPSMTTTFRQLGDVFTKGMWRHWLPDYDIRRNQKAILRQMVRENPARAAAWLAAMGNPQYLLSAYTDELGKMQQSQAYLGAFAPQSLSTGVTINGLATAPNFGADVKALIDRSQRNNGYSTTYTLPTSG